MDIEPQASSQVKNQPPPECYGTGEVRIQDRHHSCYHYIRIHPRECFTCPVERRCLAQQRRTRRR